MPQEDKENHSYDIYRIKKKKNYKDRLGAPTSTSHNPFEVKGYMHETERGAQHPF